MKRYVKEYAADLIKAYGVNSYTVQNVIKIEKIVTQCERGYITSHEAVRLLVQVAEGER